jgi:hypothetical protein
MLSGETFVALFAGDGPVGIFGAPTMKFCFSSCRSLVGSVPLAVPPLKTSMSRSVLCAPLAAPRPLPPALYCQKSQLPEPQTPTGGEPLVFGSPYVVLV